MKKITKALVIIGVLVLGIALGTNLNKSTESVVIESVSREIDDVVIELTDGSYALYNEKENMYIFQPVNLGDWDYHLENLDQLEKIIATYISMVNTGMY